jgi:hypothetical protein
MKTHEFIVTLSIEVSEKLIVEGFDVATREAQAEIEDSIEALRGRGLYVSVQYVRQPQYLISDLERMSKM